MHGDGRFSGALDLMPHQRVLRTAVVIRSGEVLRVSAERLRDLLAADAELRDLLARTFLLREAGGPQRTPELCILALPDDSRTPPLLEWAARRGLNTAATHRAPGHHGVSGRAGGPETRCRRRRRGHAH